MSGTNRGALVTAVVPGSPAALAGIAPGSIVTEVAGKPVRGAAELKTRIVTVPFGTELSVILRADGRDQRYNLRTAMVSEAGPEVTLSESEGGLDGLTVRDIAPGNPLFGDVRGSQVAKVAAGSRAERLGLRAEDVIVGIDNYDVRDTEHLYRYAERAGMTYQLRIRRQGLAGWLRVAR
jgi:S1-C subfamily serine protease